MPVKFNQYWTVDHDKVKEYEKFIIQKFVPGINQLGIHTVAGWCILVGGYTEIIFEGVTNDLELLEKALRDQKYKELNHELQNYIKKYKTKVLVNTGKKETYSIDVKENTIKFNQLWDIDSRKKDEYEKYVTEEFYPCLEKLGITIAGEWEVLIGDGPHIICEGRAQEINRLVENLQSKAFRMARLGLKRLIENYESRILVFHVQKVHGYKSSSYNMVAA